MWGNQYILGVAGILWLSIGCLRLRTGEIFNYTSSETQPTGLILTKASELAGKMANSSEYSLRLPAGNFTTGLPFSSHQTRTTTTHKSVLPWGLLVHLLVHVPSCALELNCLIILFTVPRKKGLSPPLLQYLETHFLEHWISARRPLCLWIKFIVALNHEV